MIAAGLLLLALASWLCAALLRIAGLGGTCGHPAIIGGVLAGALLGPTILGRLAPNLHEDLFVGGRSARERWTSVMAESQAQAVAERAAGLAGPLAAEVDGATEEVRSAASVGAEQSWRSAAWEAQWPQRGASALLAAILLLTALTPQPERVSTQQATDRARRIDALLIGVWSAGLPALGGVLLLRLHGWPLLDQSALWLLAALAVGPWVLGAADRRIADSSEPNGARLMQGARVAASLVAASLLLLTQAIRPLGEAALEPATPLDRQRLLGLAMALVLIFSLSPWSLLRSRRGLGSGDAPSGPGPHRATTTPTAARGDRAEERLPVTTLAALWLLPPAAALAMVRLELFRDLAPWMVLGVALLAGDGRAAGAFLGAALSGGRPPLRALRLGLVAGNAAPTQLVLTGAAATAGILAPPLALALLVAAAFVEVTGMVRPRVARSIGELEDDSDQGPPDR
jgi:hypothetical protein